jgi:tRNA A37 methylthiotransferase MiaB
MINKIETDRISGYTDNMKNVIIQPEDWTTNPKVSVGSFLNVHITDADAFKLFAKQT